MMVDFFLVLMLAGCVSSPMDLKPSVELPETFTHSGADVVPDQWWTEFNDPVLDKLMDRMLAGNFTLRGAWDRLVQARERAVQAGAGYWPGIEGSGSASRTRSESEGGSGFGSSDTESGSVTYTNDFSLGLTMNVGRIFLWIPEKSLALVIKLSGTIKLKSCVN